MLQLTAPSSLRRPQTPRPALPSPGLGVETQMNKMWGPPWRGFLLEGEPFPLRPSPVQTLVGIHFSGEEPEAQRKEANVQGDPAEARRGSQARWNLG